MLKIGVFALILRYLDKTFWSSSQTATLYYFNGIEVIVLIDLSKVTTNNFPACSQYYPYNTGREAGKL